MSTKLPDAWDYDLHPGDCHPIVIDDCWMVCCRECAGTGVFPVPWIDSPVEGRAGDPEDSSCVRCKATGRAIVALATPGGGGSVITESVPTESRSTS